MSELRIIVKPKGMFNVNPFSYEYLEREIEFIGPVETYKDDRVWMEVLHYKPSIMRLMSGGTRDWFNKAWRTKAPPTPTLCMREDTDAPWETWMSITPMEIQSMFLPIEEADGVVWTAGLGIGYYALRVAAKDDVDKVVVYETEPLVVELFERNFGDRPYFDKIEVRHGDFREALRNNEPDQDDFIFMDVYPTVCCDQALDDAKEFKPIYSRYWFWNYERVVLDAVVQWGMRPTTWGNLRRLITTWTKTNINESTHPDERIPTLGGDDGTLDHWYHPVTDPDYCRAILEAMSG